ncbi:MAG: dienelactone hydrolase family protein [Bdellovibrionia bacterium]
MKPVKWKPALVSQEVEIMDRGTRLLGSLEIPQNPLGIVIFAHGSSSNRFSPRNQAVSLGLNQAGLGSLLFDLLSEEENQDPSTRFDIPFLAHRLQVATQWLNQWLSKHLPSLQLPLGYLGSSTGAAAALCAAAELGSQITAIVSRGGRPDLAFPHLKRVVAPTLLLVGGLDVPVIAMNQSAFHELRFAQLVVIPGATHLFEESGKLEEVTVYAKSWFLQHFQKTRPQQIGA